VEEEIYILEATLLEIPKGPLYNRRDAPDKESLCELARLHGRVWKDKIYTENMDQQRMKEYETTCIQRRRIKDVIN
jgi:hypothetical protein